MKLQAICILILATMAGPLVHGDPVADLLVRAQQGEADAQYQLGEIYEKGQGVTKDVTEAVKWFSKAAEQGNGGAQFKLGGIYVGGRGVRKNSSEGAKWFRMAAEQGNTAAQCQLARMHLSGAGVPKDDLDAYMWASLAAAKGDAAAKTVVAFLMIRMTPKQITTGKLRVQDFLESGKSWIPVNPPEDRPPLPDELLPLLVPE